MANSKDCPPLPPPTYPEGFFCLGREAAEIIGVSPRTIARLTQEGYLRYAYKAPGGNGWFFYETEYVRRWAAWNHYDEIPEGGEIPDEYPPGDVKPHFTRHKIEDFQ